ncbi:MAG: HAMP domain-containing histidine kinase [Gammaproteobacteria bacterium]|nr:HAMP domain-containing histidine kinase [Gammaproteobacteria bacterium]
MQNSFNSKIWIWGGFILAVSLIAVVMAMGLNMIDRGIHEQERVSYTNATKSELLTEMRAAVRERNISLQRMLTMQTDEELEREWERIGKFGGVFAFAREQYIVMNTTAKELTLMAQQADISNRIGPLQNRVAELLLFGEKSQASSVLVNDVIPEQEKVFDLLSELLKLQKTNARQAALKAEDDFHLLVSSIITMGLLLLITTSIIIYFITERISRSEMELKEHRDHLEDLVHERTEDLEQALDLAEQANMAKTEFVSTVSHELRTPLTSIIGSLSLVVSEKVGAIGQKNKDLLALAENNARRLSLLINDILDIQKIESGKMEYEFKDISLRALVNQVITDVQPYADKFQVAVKPCIDDQEIHILGDYARLTQVLNNLISNAIKFSPQYDLVEIEVIDEMEKVHVQVRDHGPGIPAEYRQSVFDKFTQVDSSDTRAHGGTGLGLSISKAIIEVHHGEIGVLPNEEKGSIFYVELPKFYNPEQVTLH